MAKDVTGEAEFDSIVAWSIFGLHADVWRGKLKAIPGYERT